MDDSLTQVCVVVTDVRVVFAQEARACDHGIDDDANEEAADEHADPVHQIPATPTQPSSFPFNHQLKLINEPVKAVVKDVEVAEGVHKRVVDGRHQGLHHEVVGELLGGVHQREVAFGHIVALRTRLATTKLDQRARRLSNPRAHRVCLTEVIHYGRYET